MKSNSVVLLIIIISLAVSSLNCAHDKQEKNIQKNSRTSEMIDLYRLEVAYQINKNWEFKGRTASDSDPMVRIVFRIMPDGEIRNIQYIQKSGHPELDESAYLAIQRTNPTESFPKGLKTPYVEMGLVFAPEGVR